MCEEHREVAAVIVNTITFWLKGKHLWLLLTKNAESADDYPEPSKTWCALVDEDLSQAADGAMQAPVWASTMHESPAGALHEWVDKFFGGGDGQ